MDEGDVCVAGRFGGVWLCFVALGKFAASDLPDDWERCVVSSFFRCQRKTPEFFDFRGLVLVGLEGLNDLPRSGQPRKLSTQKMKEILTLTTQRVPREATHWSVRLMAKYAAVTAWQVRQVWAASDLKPHRLKTFKISNNPHFADKVVDVIGLYLDPPDNAVVLSVA